MFFVWGTSDFTCIILRLISVFFPQHFIYVLYSSSSLSATLYICHKTIFFYRKPWTNAHQPGRSMTTISSTCISSWNLSQSWTYEAKKSGRSWRTYSDFGKHRFLGFSFLLFNIRLLTLYRNKIPWMFIKQSSEWTQNHHHRVSGRLTSAIMILHILLSRTVCNSSYADTLSYHGKRLPRIFSRC